MTMLRNSPAMDKTLAPGYFAKYQALGNAYLVCDGRNMEPAAMVAARHWCDVHYGIGADGILWLTACEPGHYTLLIMNPDGSFAEKSGNGLRIMARWLWDHGWSEQQQFSLQVGPFVGQATIVPSAGRAEPQVGMTMGAVQFGFPKQQRWSWQQVQRPYVVPLSSPAHETLYVTPVDVGNPHCVIWDSGFSAAQRLAIANQVSHHAWFPERCNVQWLTVVDRSNVAIEIVERGVGPTLASGSSACAAAAAAMANNQVEQQVMVHMAGGYLQVTMDERGMLYQQGDVTKIAQGKFASY